MLIGAIVAAYRGKRGWHIIPHAGHARVLGGLTVDGIIFSASLLGYRREVTAATCLQNVPNEARENYMIGQVIGSLCLTWTSLFLTSHVFPSLIWLGFLKRALSPHTHKHVRTTHLDMNVLDLPTGTHS